MQESKMSNEGRTLKWSLQPSTHLSEIEAPATTLASPAPDNEFLGFQGLQRFKISYLKEAENQDGPRLLVAGYARWIMAVVSQSVVTFWIMARDVDGAIERAIVVARRTTQKDALTWEAYEATVIEGIEVEFGLYLLEGREIDTHLPSSVRVALCVDLQWSIANLVYRSVNDEGVGILRRGKLEACLECPDAIAFWEKELQEFVGCPERQFPTISCDRLMVSPTNAQTLTSNITMGLSWERLKTLAQQMYLKSAISVIRAAFAYILAEYLESDRVILADRPLAESKGTLESLIPIVILPDDTATSLLSRVDDFTARSAHLPHTSVEVLHEILQVPPESTLSSATFLHHVKDTSERNSGTVSQNTVWPCSEAPLVLKCQISKLGALILTLSISASSMDQSHLELSLKQIDVLTTIMLSRPTDLIQDLTNFFPTELLSVHCPSASEELRHAPLLSPAHWVDYWSSTNPNWNAIEIIDEVGEEQILSQKYTYGYLSNKSNQICRWIQTRGWYNRSIAVCLGRSFVAYALVLAIWKSGNCYVPVAEDLPDARQQFLLADSGAIAFFTDQNVATTIVPPTNCLLVNIDDPELIENPGVVDQPTAVRPSPSDNCYLLYTSGSTGSPKGVLVSRGNLSAFTEAQSEYICREAPDTLNLKGSGSYLAHASRAFDVHICEMVLGWRHGLRLVTGPRTLLLDNLSLVLSRMRITHAGFVPSLLEHAGVSAEKLPDLRYLGVGGEKISETIIERFVDKPSIALVNAYGPTEVTIGMTSHTVKPWSTVRNIGTAVGNITIHVLEADTFRYVKRGHAGELCVTGDLVANGYHNRPDAGGFTEFNGQRMYRTGDIVRLMANNCIEYLGRRDSQAKIRGQRLELEEVSVAVRRCAKFPVNVTSIVTPSPITRRPQLVSFMTPSANKSDGISSKPTFLQERYQEWVPGILASCCAELPAYMVPNVLLPISFIPIQISGKADTRRLAALYESIPASDLLLGIEKSTPSIPGLGLETSCTALTAEEEYIRDIICAQLRVERDSIAKSTNIFQLGMDSLASLAIAANMRRAGYICAAADVLSNATVAQLACLPKSHASSNQGSFKDPLLDQADEASQILTELDQDCRASQKHLSLSSISIIRPCLPLQESLVSNSIGSPSPLYVNHIMCRLGHGIQIPALKIAFKDLMEENEILRTCFHVTDCKVVQVVLKPRATQFPWTQLPVCEESEAISLFKSLQTGIASRIIRDLETKPPFHLLAAEGVDEKPSGWLMLSIHHSIFDGASMNIFLDRLHRHYSGNVAIQSVDPTPLYRYFVIQPQKQSEQFWTDYLMGCAPTLFVSQQASGDAYQIVTRKLPFTLSKISKFASKHWTTATMILETAWAIALAKLLGQNDIIYGRVSNGRGIPVEKIDSMLVPLVTTVPGRFQFPFGELKLLDQIKSHTEGIIKSMRYQHTPLRAIQRYAGASGPLFNSLFSYLAIEPRSPADGMLLEIDSYMQADYALALEVRAESDPDSVTLRLRIADDPTSNENAHVLIETISTLVEGLLSNGDVIIDRPTISKVEKQEQPRWDEAKWTEDEITFRQAVAEVAGIPDLQIAKNASFFALGIDSVTSLHLSRSLRMRGFKVSSSDILRYPSIGALAGRLEHSMTTSKIPVIAEPKITSYPSVDMFDMDDSVVEMYPCTPLQTAMIGECISSEGKRYVHHHTHSLSCSIDIEKLFRAWKVATEQIDILRTSFHRREGSREIYAAVHRSSVMNWSHQTSVASFPAVIGEIASQSAYPSMKDFATPPWRITILTGDTQHLMVVTMHHSLYDGFSLPMLFDFLEKQYHGTTSHIDSFASVAQKIVSSQESSVQFWANSVAGYQCPHEPLPPVSILDSTVQWAEVKVQTPTSTLQYHCGLLGVTLQTVALLAFARSLALHLGQRDVVFGHVVSGRGYDGVDTTSVIGPLFNTVPFRLKLDSSSQSVRSSLQEIQRFCIDSQPYHHAPLGLVQQGWRLTSDENSLSLCNAIFSFNKVQFQDNESIFHPYELAKNPDVPHYPLNVEFNQTKESLVLRATSHCIFGNDNLDSWLIGVADGIEDIISSSDQPVLKFPPGLADLPLAINLPRQPEEQPDLLDNGKDIQKLRKIFSDITNIPICQIQESSSVFALGVDSILALDTSAQCRKVELMVSASDILQGRTIQGIAKLAAKKRTASLNSKRAIQSNDLIVSPSSRSQALSNLGLSEESVEAVLPCLSGQLFYISAWLQSKRKLWEFTFALQSNTKIELERIQLAWAELQKRNGILRTSFVAVSSGEILQIVHKAANTNQVTPLNRERSTNSLNMVVQDEIHHISGNPSDLFTPPARLHLIQHPESDILLLTLHHALYDARSLPILVDELETLYHRGTLAPPVDFTSFVLHIHPTSVSDSALRYWTKSLGMGQRTSLGKDFNIDVSNFRIESLERTFRKGLDQIQDQSHSTGTSVPSMILLAVGRSLALLTGTTHPAFGLFQSGRSSEYPDLHNMVGPTVNMLPLVVPNALKTSILDGLMAMQNDLIQRMLHDQTNLGALRQNLRSLGNDLQFNLVVNIIWGQLSGDETKDQSHAMLKPFHIGSQFQSEVETPVPRETSVDKFDWRGLIDANTIYLEVRPVEQHHGLQWRLDYTSAVITDREAELLVDTLEKELGTILESI